MDVSDRLLCLFSEQIEQQNGSYVIEVPERELELGDLNEGEVYRVAVIGTRTEPDVRTDGDSGTDEDSPQVRGLSGPPVTEGEIRKVEIEDIGQQGDGVARVERGYVIIVPDAERGERVRVEITNVRENVAFAEVVKRLEYYD